MSNLLDLKKREKENRKSSQNVRKIDRPLYSNQGSQVEDEEEIIEEQNLYQNSYDKTQKIEPVKSPEQSELPKTTIGLMLGTAIFFDLSQIVFAFAFMDWMVSWFAFLTFWLWFKFHNRSFVHPKRALAIGTGVIIEMIPVLAVLPGWTVTIILLIGIEKAEKKAKKLLGDGTLANKAVSRVSRFSSK